MARAAGELARADILRPETPLGFVHPLVRDVVYLDPRRAVAKLPPELADRRQALEAVELMSMYFGAYDAERLRALERYRDAREGNGPGARMVAAASAFAWAAAGGPAARCEALALESLAGGELLASANGLFLSAALVALIIAESPRTPEFLAAARAKVHRTGTIFSTASVEMWRASTSSGPVTSRRPAGRSGSPASSRTRGARTRSARRGCAAWSAPTRS